MTEQQLIIGWKAIAKYLNSSEHTARMYHRQFGLPILRLPSKRPVLYPDMVFKWLLELNIHVPSEKIGSK